MSTGSRWDREEYELCDVLGMPRVVRIEGVSYEILPITVEELPEFRRNMATVQAASVTPDDLEAKRLGDNASCRVIELVTRQSFDVFESLPVSVRDALLDAGYRANWVLFGNGRLHGEVSQKGRSTGSDEIDVALAVLVEAGHGLDAIKGYTLSQVAVLSRAHAQLAAERQISAMVAARSGQVKSEDFKRMVSDLQRTAVARGSARS